jgi:phosphoglucomutase
MDSLIISASGWRFVYSPEALGWAERAALAFSEFLTTAGTEKRILVGRDTRPSGEALAAVFHRVFCSYGMTVLDAGVTAAPEIMAASAVWGVPFAYVSASHNPVEYNGFKFGLGDGGVLDGKTNAAVAERFKKGGFLTTESTEDTEVRNVKACVLSAYREFMLHLSVPSVSSVVIISDMNGSARTRSIDKEWFEGLGCEFQAFNTDGIVHGILPEGENLLPLAAEVRRVALSYGAPPLILGYMPDCDGDRGNVVFWDEAAGEARVLEAQEVFALALTAVLKTHGALGTQKLAAAVNGPTSMRVEAIAAQYGAAVFRAEVGEANVVNLAREKRAQGWAVPLLGEGSNGGTIAHPEAVRDPLATVTLLLGLAGEAGSLAAAIGALPAFTTTPVDDARAKLHIRERDHAALKRRYQRLFEARWPALRERFGFTAYRAVGYVGTATIDCGDDFGKTGTGGLKVLFFEPHSGDPAAFIWCRGSGTEPVFRVMADVRGVNVDREHDLLAVQRELLEAADTP